RINREREFRGNARTLAPVAHVAEFPARLLDDFRNGGLGVLNEGAIRRAVQAARHHDFADGLAAARQLNDDLEPGLLARERAPDSTGRGRLAKYNSAVNRVFLHQGPMLANNANLDWRNEFGHGCWEAARPGAVRQLTE